MEAALKKFLEEARNKGGTLQKYWWDARMCVDTPSPVLPLEAKLNSTDRRSERREVWKLRSGNF